MAKRQRTSKAKEILSDQADQLKKATDKAAERAAAASGQPVGNEYLEQIERGREKLARRNRRKDYESDKGRRRYNTMMHPELKEALQALAAAQGVTVPDLIEELLCKQIGLKPPSES